MSCVHRILLVALLVLALSPGALAIDAGAASTVGDNCPRARGLVKRADPTAAIALIEQRRQAVPRPDAKVQACESTYLVAARHQALASAWMGWVARLERRVATARTVGGDSVGVPVAPRSCREKTALPPEVRLTSTPALIDRGVQEAIACNRFNEAALARRAILDAPAPSRGEAAEKSWATYFTKHVQPWVTLLGVLLVWLAVGLVVARTLRRLLRNRGAWSMPQTEGLQRALRVAGWVLLTSGSLLGIGLLDLDARPPESAVLLGGATFFVLGIGWLLVAGLASQQQSGALQRTAAALILGGPALVTVSLVELSEPGTPEVPLGVTVVTAGALLLALGWRARARLSVSVADGDGVTADGVRSLVRSLGSSRPRGLEVPIGSEASFLEDVGVAKLASGTVAQLLATVAALARPVDPWQLTVVAHSTDRLTVELTRNREVVSSENIERRRLLPFLETDSVVPAPERTGEQVTPDLAPFAAAIALVEMAIGHGQTEGLGGATRWRSVALQYLGSVQPRRSPVRAPLFAAALNADPGNRAAQLSLWYALFRDSDGEEDLGTYRGLLEGFLASSDQAEVLLRLRALHTRVAVGINLVSIGGSDPVLAERGVALLALAESQALSTDREQADFAAEQERHARALVRSISSLAGDPPSERPLAVGPGLAYSLACYWGSPGVLGGPGALRDPQRAVAHLVVANLDPELDRWRREDPQLTRLRETVTYRAKFGMKPETDVLAVAPFSAAKEAFRAAGLSSIARLASVPRTWLVDLGVNEPAARWMIQLAQMASRLPPGLEEWRVPMLKMLAEDGLTELPVDEPGRQALYERIRTAATLYRTSPDEALLAGWLGLDPPTP